MSMEEEETKAGRKSLDALDLIVKLHDDFFFAETFYLLP